LSDHGPAALIELPPSMSPPQRAERRAFSATILLITDGLHLPDEPHQSAPQRLMTRLQAVLRAVPPGAIAVQLRNRQVSTGALHRLAQDLRQLTLRYAAPLLINDRLDVALTVGADGVHLPGQGLPVQSARALLGAGRVLSAAAHSLPEARMALLAGADAVTLSPIWDTPSKPPRPDRKDDVRPLSKAVLSAAVAQLGRPYDLPIFALGGIDSLSRVRECAAQGARVACLRALLSGEEDEVAARAVAFVAAVAGATSTAA